MKKKFFIINCIMMFLLITVYEIPEYIIKLNDFVLLNWVNFAFASIFTIISIFNSNSNNYFFI